MIRVTCFFVAIMCGAFGFSTSAVHAQSDPVPLNSSLIEDAPDLFAMLQSMGVYDVLQIIRTETIQGSADVEAQLFPGAGGETWRTLVTALHSSDRLIAMFEGAIERDTLSGEHIATVTEFLTSPAGQTIIAGELATREAFLDATVVRSAIQDYTTLRADEANARIEILQRFNDVNGLIDRNVTGALNLRFAFYRGLIDGGAFEGDVPEQVMLSEVWGQEPDVRDMTVDWLFSYQLNAYAEVSDADLEAYVALSDSEAGRAVNTILFAAFDEMLADLSYDLGVAAASFIAGEDI